MKELGLQLFTIRDFMRSEEDIRESFQKMRKYGYTQAQTAGCAIPYADFGRIAREEGRKEGCKAMEERAKIAREEGRKEGIRIFILDNAEEGKTARQIQEKLMRCFQLSAELAEQYYLQYAQG